MAMAHLAAPTYEAENGFQQSVKKGCESPFSFIHSQSSILFNRSEMLDRSRRTPLIVFDC